MFAYCYSHLYDACTNNVSLIINKNCFIFRISFLVVFVSAPSHFLGFSFIVFFCYLCASFIYFGAMFCWEVFAYLVFFI